MIKQYKNKKMHFMILTMFGLLLLSNFAILAAQEAQRTTVKIPSTAPVMQAKLPKRFTSSEFVDLFQKIRQYGREGKSDEVIAECKKLIKQYPKDQDILIGVYQCLGFTYLKIGTYDKSIEAFQKCKEIGNTDKKRYEYFLASADGGIGQCYYLLKKFGQALQILQKLIDAYPDTVAGIDMAGIIALPLAESCFNAKGQPEEFIFFLENILKEHPNTMVAKYAKEKLDSPELLRKQYQKGEQYLAEGKLTQALNIFQKIASEYPKSNWTDDALYMIGECLLKQKKYQEAINAYQKVINEYPKTNVWGGALDGLFRVYSAQGRYEEALKTFERYGLPEYQRLGKEKAIQAQFDISKYYVIKLKNYKGSIYAFQRFVEKHPKHRLVAQAQYNIAECYKEIGNYSNAAAYYQEVINKFPDTESASLAEWRIKELRKEGKISGTIGPPKPERRLAKVFTRQQLVKLIGIPLVALIAIIYICVLIVRWRKKK